MEHIPNFEMTTNEVKDQQNAQFLNFEESALAWFSQIQLGDNTSSHALRLTTKSLLR